MSTPSKPLEEMTEAEVCAWKDWLLEEGSRPRPFVWGRAPQTFAGRALPRIALAVTADGRAVSASGCGLDVWDLASGRQLLALTGHTAAVLSVAVSADGKWAVSASDDGTLKVWDLERGRERHALAGHTAPVCSVAVSADGKWAVSGLRDGTLKVWDVEQACARHTLAGHTGEVLSVALSANGMWAVSASHDWTLKVWDLERGRERNTLVGHAAPVRSVAVSADGKWAVSASDDSTLSVWDLASGALLRKLEGHGGNVVAVTPDGRIVSVSDDGKRRVWKLTHPVSESEFDYEPALNKVIERSADGKRYVVGVRNAELQRIQELKDEGKSSFLPGLDELRSR